MKSENQTVVRTILAANQDRDAFEMFAPFSCSVGERNDGAIFIPKSGCRKEWAVKSQLGS